MPGIFYECKALTEIPEGLFDHNPEVTYISYSFEGCSSLRSVLGLRSACFEWEVQDGKLVFFVTGFGHGVGLSQYGANQMAADGADYLEIATHYYTGVTVEPYLPG